MSIENNVIQDLMNRGFIISENVDHTWTVQKVATALAPFTELPTDEHTILGPRIPFVMSSVAGFESQEVAIRWAKQVAGLDSGQNYVIEVKYNNGLGPKFQDLGTVTASTFEDADRQAGERVAAHFATSRFQWAYRIRPTGRSD